MYVCPQTLQSGWSRTNMVFISMFNVQVHTPKKNKDVMLKFEGFIQIISIILNAFSSVGHNGISQFFLEYLTHCAIS